MRTLYPARVISPLYAVECWAVAGARCSSKSSFSAICSHGHHVALLRVGIGARADIDRETPGGTPGPPSSPCGSRPLRKSRRRLGLVAGLALQKREQRLQRGKTGDFATLYGLRPRRATPSGSYLATAGSGRLGTPSRPLVSVLAGAVLPYCAQCRSAPPLSVDDRSARPFYAAIISELLFAVRQSITNERQKHYHPSHWHYHSCSARLAAPSGNGYNERSTRIPPLHGSASYVRVGETCAQFIGITCCAGRGR